jgi:hypothetical protein
MDAAGYVLGIRLEIDRPTAKAGLLEAQKMRAGRGSWVAWSVWQEVDLQLLPLWEMGTGTGLSQRDVPRSLGRWI